jgi:hypothetical protein
MRDAARVALHRPTGALKDLRRQRQTAQDAKLPLCPVLRVVAQIVGQQRRVKDRLAPALDFDPVPPADQGGGRQFQDCRAQGRLFRPKAGDLGTDFGQFIGGAQVMHALLRLKLHRISMADD